MSSAETKIKRVGDGKKEDGEERQARECFETSAVLVLVLVLVLRYQPGTCLGFHFQLAKRGRRAPQKQQQWHKRVPKIEWATGPFLVSSPGASGLDWAEVPEKEVCE
ncbi:hypothetical protein FVEG_04140 [Fusarium verticillioides 7600]|uniref:Uncharacterized protein n=1 Tax=Gibberella moniliformis (strain M3125 / FGSC 7600) TaxID=334819 RepID=W7M3Y1_GIBM7|nr:hypothetical protein FVEG_04140 [Fusarium verticillioides 7600]EWG42260.1 hypothetical protein FVEG_04140 [Fusarium verticillioides 7600]